MILLISLPVHAADQKGWEPRPLIDTAVPNATAPAANTNLLPSPATPDVDAMLEPVEPFIAGIESELGIVPLAETGSRLNRLNHIQDILFGDRIYDDAGDLLARLAEIFPQQAAEAQETLQARLRETVMNPDMRAEPDKVSSSGSKKSFAKSRRHAKKSKDKNQNTNQNANQNIMASSSVPNYGYSQQTYQPLSPQPQQQQPQQQNYQNQSYAQRAQRGEGLKSFGRGLMQLAMVGGSLAGAYYLNRQMGSVNTGPNPYNTYSPYGAYSPYGYSPYGSYGAVRTMAPAYTYGGYGSGGLYTAPYGYGGYNGYNSYGGVNRLLNGLF